MKISNLNNDLQLRQRRLDETLSPDLPLMDMPTSGQSVTDEDTQPKPIEEDFKSFLKARLKRHTAPPELITSIRQQVKGDFHFPR